MTDPGIPAIFITLTTLCSAIMIGVGFLPSPSRASVIWSSGFVCGMIASYLTLASTVAEGGSNPLLNAASGGFVLLTLGLIWVGVRVYGRRTRDLLLPTIAGTVLVTIVLAVLGVNHRGLAETIGMFVAAVILAWTVAELLALHDAPRTATLPLAIGAGAGAVFAALWFVIELIRPIDATDGMSGVIGVIHADAAMMQIVYFVTALVTTLLLSRGAEGRSVNETHAGFDRVARDRLARAARAGDAWWSLLDVRLDDPLELREATSTLAFTRVLDRFARDVVDAVPPEADIEQVDQTRVLVLLPRPDAAVRPVMQGLLERLSTVSEGQSASVRLSASIGWASVSSCGHDLDELTQAAAAAAEEARQEGGDRWERAVAEG